MEGNGEAERENGAEEDSEDASGAWKEVAEKKISRIFVRAEELSSRSAPGRARNGIGRARNGMRLPIKGMIAPLFTIET